MGEMGWPMIQGFCHGRGGDDNLCCCQLDRDSAGRIIVYVDYKCKYWTLMHNFGSELCFGTSLGL